MMQNPLYFYCLIICFYFLFQPIYSQVGINTTQPRKDLEVNGDMRISEEIKIQKLKPIQNNQKATFLIQDTDNKIRSMDVTGNSNAALGYVVKYNLTNPNGDWISNFNTRINAQDYTVSIVSAFFDKEVHLPNSDIFTYFFTIPNYTAFVDENTWRLKADYPDATIKGGQGTWTITLMIFPKDFAKALGNQTIDMRGNNTKTAETLIID